MSWRTGRQPRPSCSPLSPSGPRADRAASRSWSPGRYWDPDTEEAAITLEFAIPLLDTAAGSHVQGIVGATDPYEAVRQTLEHERYDEVIISTLPERVSRWLHLDLAHRIERFGVPVSVVTADQAERTLLPGTGSV